MTDTYIILLFVAVNLACFFSGLATGIALGILRGGGGNAPNA